MKRKGLLAGVLLLCLAPAAGGSPPEEAPDPPWRSSEGDFEAMLLLTVKPEEFLEGWVEPAEGTPLDVATSVTRGVPIVAFIAFTGCRSDKNGLCNTTVDFNVLKPDESPYGGLTGKELWRGKPAPPEGVSQLGVGFLRVTIEPEDPLGTYVVEAMVRDLTAGVSLDLRQIFEALEGSSEGGPP